MKLTPVNNKLYNSIWKPIRLDVDNKTSNSTSWEVYRKMKVEICYPNYESISRMQIGILNKLKNEINTSK